MYRSLSMIIFNKWPSTLSLLLLLSACANNERDTQALLDLPEAPSAWVENTQSIGNPQNPLETEFPIEVQDLVIEALSHNRELRSAAAAIDTLLARRTISRSTLFPSLSFELENNQAEQIDDGSRTFESSYSSSVFSSWEFDLWGKLRNARQAADAELLAEQFNVDAFKQSLMARVILKWLDIVEAKRRLELSEKSYGIQVRRQAQLERRLDSGLADALDIRLNSNNLANTEDTLYQRQLSYKQHVRELEVLLGRYPKADIQSPQLLPLIDSFDISHTPATLLLNRPDLLEKEAELKASKLRVREAKKMLYPSLSISASYQNSDDSYGELYDFSAWLGRFSASLLQPIFQGGRLRAGVKLEQAQMLSTVADYEQAVLEAWREVENHLHAESIILKQIKALELALKEAQAAEKLTLNKYEQGLATSFEYLSAQNRSINAEDALITTQVSSVANRVNLHLALGMPVIKLSPEN